MAGRVIVFGMLTVVVGLAYGRVLFGGQTFAGDHLLVEIPSREFLARSVASLNVPEWWPNVGLGVPFAANPEHLALYPPAWILGVLPMPWGADALLAAHALWGAAGAWMFARRMGADRLGGVVAGGVFATCGALSANVGSAATLLSISWLPWVFLCVSNVARSAGWRERGAHAVWLACAFGAALLAGDVSVAVAGALASVGVSLATGKLRRGVSAMNVVGGLVGGLLPAAVLLIPAASLGLLGLTRTGADAFRLAAYVWPGSGMAAYVGLPAVVLAAIAAIRGRVTRELGAVAILAAVLSALLWAPLAAPACVLLCALAGVGATEIGQRCARVPWMERAGPAAVAAVAVGVTLGSGFGSTGLRPRAEIARRPALLPDASSATHPPRIYRPHPKVTARYVGKAEVDDYALVPANTATRFGFAYARGRDAAIPPRVGDAWRAAAVASEAFFDLYDVEYMLVPASVVFPSGMPVVGRVPGGRLALVRNKRRRARGFVAPQWMWHRNDVLLRGHLFSPGKGIRLGTVQLIGSGPAAPPRTGAVPSPACAVDYPSTDRATLSCDSKTGGYAVLLDAWAPGWSATVDGKAAPVLRADSLVRAVAVAAGSHSIAMRYRTPGLRLGGAISLLALLNALVLAIVRRRSRAHDVTRED